MPIIGATKERHVLEAAQVVDTVLTPEGISDGKVSQHHNSDEYLYYRQCTD